MKKKVLFALIALFSFVGAWAAPTDGVEVTVGTYKVYLSKAAVILENGTATAPTVNGIKVGEAEAVEYAGDTPVLYGNNGQPVSQINGVGNYFLKITNGTGTNKKNIYVPFQAWGPVDYEYISTEATFNSSVADGALSLYYTDPNMDSSDDKDNDGHPLWSIAASSIHATGKHKYDSNKGFPWVAFKAPTFAGQYKPRVEYTKKNNDDPVSVADATPWGERVFGLADNDKKYGIMSVIAGDGVLSGTDATYMVSTEVPATKEFNKDGLKIFWTPTEAAYEGGYDYSWTMLPVAGNYTGNPHTPAIDVKGYKGDGDPLVMQKCSLEQAGPTREYQDYKVEYFASAEDAEAGEHSIQMVDAGIYYVKVSVYTGTVDNVDQWLSLGTKQYVIAATVLELTLQKLEKNYKDPDPVFENMGPAGWMYLNPAGGYSPFYTLKNGMGQQVSTSEARLLGVEFERVTQGDDVYDKDGNLAQYSYTVPVTNIHVVKANPMNDGHEGLSEADWDQIDLEDKSTYSENYTIVNGSVEKLQIIRRDISTLEIKADSVYYTGSQLTLDDVKLTGLSFMPRGAESEDAAIVVNPLDTKNFTVTYGENINVKYKEGSTDDLTKLATGGTVTITAKAGGNFMGTKTVPFVIRPRNLGDWDITYSGANAANVETSTTVKNTTTYGDFTFYPYATEDVASGATIYNGADQIPTKFASALYGTKGMTLYTVVNEVGSGDYEIIAENEEYDLINYRDANVQPKNATEWEARKVLDYVLNVDAGTGSWTVRKENNKDVTFARPYVYIEGHGNFTGVRKVEFDIYPMNINDKTKINAEIAAAQYTGEELKPEITIHDTRIGAAPGALLVERNNPTPEQVMPGDDQITPVEGDYRVEVTGDNTVNGEHHVAIYGVGNYWSNISDNFDTEGAVLEIALDQESMSKTYGNADPDFDGTISITGWQNDDDLAKKENPSATEIAAGKIYLDKDNKACVRANAKKSDLYNALMAAITITREAGETVTESPYKFSYATTSAVVDGKFGNYTLNFKDWKDAVVDDPTTDDDETAPAVIPVFTIEKAPLTVTAKSITEEFGDDLDNKTDWTTGGYTITGWATGTLEENGISYTFADDEASVITAKGAKIEVNVVKAANTAYSVGTPYALVPSVNPNNTVLDNYVFNFVNGTLTVSAATIHVIAKAKTLTYGELNINAEGANNTYTQTVDNVTKTSYFDYDITGFRYPAKKAGETDKQYAERKDGILADLKEEIGNPFVQIVPEPAEGATDPTNGGLNVGTYVIDVERDEEGKPTTAHLVTEDGDYDIVYEPAALVIEKLEVTVTALDQTIPYGGAITTDIVIGVQGEGDATVNVAPAALPYDEPITGKKGLTITLSRADDPEYTAVGVYDPEEYDNEAGIKVEVAPKDNYTFNCVYGTLTIEGDAGIYLVRPYLNSDELWENQRGGTIWFQEERLVEAEEGDEVEEEEEAEPEYETVFVRRGKSAEAEEWFDVTQTRGLNTDAETWGDEDYDDAIVDNTTAQQIKDYGGQKGVTVRFGHYAIMADQWESLVLPFDIDVRFVSPMFGYALFNVIDEAKSTSDNLVFKKENRKIPANTPFLIKATNNTDLHQLVFRHVEIKNPKTEAELTVEAAGNKFIGTYTGYWNKEAKADGKARAQFFGGKLYDGKNHQGLTTTLYEFPLGAYFEFSSAASAGVRITVVDENGISTDINVVEIAEDGAADAEFAEGWYTITGIKLDAKPTEKGVYIYNGKKVSIQ